MLKVNISDENDVAEGIKMRKRAQFEEERKKRIFNAKQRLFGIDTAFIEKQVAEKAKRKQAEKDNARRYEAYCVVCDDALTAKSREQEKRQRRNQLDLNYYRCNYQRCDQRREHDLNDRNALKKAKPLRVADDDVDLGLASCQVFAGEDLGYPERKKRQHEQQRAWLDQQVKERKQAEEAKRTADEKWRSSWLGRDWRLEDTTVSQQRVRDQMLSSVRQYNMKLARDKRMERERERKNTMEDDAAEIYNMMTSDMLTENPEVAQSCTNPKKKVAYMYRGMTSDELDQFRKDQELQRKEDEERKTREKLLDAHWEQYALNTDRQLKLKEVKLDNREKKIFNDIVEFNEKLAKQKRREKEADRRKDLEIGIRDEFYENFNKTTR